MYNAKIITENGNIIPFGYEYGVLFDISPLSGITVDVNTSQGFQQIGTTVESMGVGGISRTINGVFMDGYEAAAKSMIASLPVMTTGTLQFNDESFCNIVVSKTPTVTKKNGITKFTMMVYCADPFWYDIESNVYSMGSVTKKFKLPAKYNSHIYAVRDASAFTDCYNYGSVKTAPDITFTASSSVTNYGLLNAETMEYIKINDTITTGDVVRVYRENTRLKVEKTRNGVTDNIFECLDEYSDLFWIHPNKNILKMTAETNSAGLQCTVQFRNAYMGVTDAS